MDTKISVGSVVYFYDETMQVVVQAIVTDMYLLNGQMAVEVSMNAIIEGEDERPIFGTTCCKLDDIHLNMDFAEEHDDDLTVADYCKQISTLEDLIRFAIRYHLDSMHPNALEAYKKRARELVGIQLI